MFRVVLVLICCFVVLAAGTSGQDADPIKVGDRIRLTYSCAPKKRLGAGGMVETCRKDAGILATMTTDSVVLTNRGRAAVSVAIAAVRTVETAPAHKDHTIAGALIGTGFGAGFGAAAFANHCISEPAPCPGAGAVVLALPGLLFGALAGKALSADRWVQVPSERLRVSLAPERKKFAVRLSVTF